MKIAWVRNEKTPKANNLLQMAGGKAIKKNRITCTEASLGQAFSTVSRKSLSEVVNELNANAFR